jgi:hypothetical protein
VTPITPLKAALNLYDPFICRICVQGAVDQSWAEQLNGLTVSSQTLIGDTAPTTVLFGLMTDQAALIGLVNALYSLGLPLVSVECAQIAR